MPYRGAGLVQQARPKRGPMTGSGVTCHAAHLLAIPRLTIGKLIEAQDDSDEKEEIDKQARVGNAGNCTRHAKKRTNEQGFPRQDRQTSSYTQIRSPQDELNELIQQVGCMNCR